MKTVDLSRTYADLLAEEAAATGDDPQLGILKKRLLIPVAIVSVLLLVWMAFAPLSGAVVAPAAIKVDLNRKTVQHQEGGIVREVMVRDGQRVHAGQALMVIGDLRNKAELHLLQDELHAQHVRIARATGEAALAERFEAPREEDNGALARETALFVARRRTLDEQLVALEAQLQGARAQITALGLQINASDESATLSHDELAMNERLTQQGYVQGARILQLKRAEADYRGRKAETQSNLGVALQREADLKERLAQIRNQYRQQAVDELKDATAKSQELQERLQPSLDQVERQVVRSPVDGEVMSMKVAGVGEVIAPRAPLLDVVPADARLVVEARIRPQDINHVRKDAAAEVRLTSFDARTTPLLKGNVTFVSGDRITTADGRESYFTATVEVDAGVLSGNPDIRLQPGMPAELYILTGKRSLFEYLLRPVAAFAFRAMREP